MKKNDSKLYKKLFPLNYISIQAPLKSLHAFHPTPFSVMKVLIFVKLNSSHISP